MNENDQIKDFLRSKLDNYEVPVADNIWQRIDDTLSRSARMRVIRRRWILSGAAAVLAIVIGSTYLLKSPSNNPSILMTDKKAMTENIPAASTNAEQNTQNKSISIDKKEVQPLIVSTEMKKPNKNHTKKPFLRSQHFKNEENIKLETYLINSIEKETEEKLLATDSEDKTDNDEMFYEIEQIAAQNYLTLAESKEEKPLTLALNTKGGLTSTNRTMNSPVTLRSAEVAHNFAKSNFILASQELSDDASDNVSQMTHSQPVSVGLTISKPLTEKLSLESGLVYTYLYSKAKNTSNIYRKKETQQLHYLGIPLNLNYNLVSFGNADLYLSLGGIIEKDVYGKYNYVDNRIQDELNSESEVKVSERIRQPHPQLSINAGVGVSYPVWNNFYLYGKIGGGYYFDADNKWSTIYSDEKIILDLNIGLRFGF
ncbi:MAG TPA: outer membrane beta-barrel protein [Dysgonamonadaceae bacterium]|nr:outer membrane beta-barrel protein [Dysgonamonadaceae bacterium]HPD43963.1 outer membrane beta-barrel protein [Dysgonamonadaceae bacterium]